jgi:stage III sporulation protein SpoIIIAA
VVINHLKEENKVKLLFVGSPVDGQEYYLREIEKIIFDNIIQEKVKIIPLQST